MELSTMQENVYLEISSFGWEFDYNTDDGDVVMVRREYIGDSLYKKYKVKIDKAGNRVDLDT
jgi:hypothetical protein